MATTPAATPNPNSPRILTPALTRSERLRACSLLYGAGSDDWREKEAVKRIRAVLPRHSFLWI